VFLGLIIIIVMMLNRDMKNSTTSSLVSSSGTTKVVTTGASPRTRGQLDNQISDPGAGGSMKGNIKQLPISSLIRKFSGTEWEV
jgi:hypothetical protein